MRVRGKETAPESEELCLSGPGAVGKGLSRGGWWCGTALLAEGSKPGFALLDWGWQCPTALCHFGVITVGTKKQTLPCPQWEVTTLQ